MRQQLYRHYKNRKLYQIVCEAEQEDTGINQVVYFCIENPPRFFVRPKKEFFETFENGIERFEPVFELDQDISPTIDSNYLVFSHSYGK